MAPLRRVRTEAHSRTILAVNNKPSGPLITHGWAAPAVLLFKLPASVLVEAGGEETGQAYRATRYRTSPYSLKLRTTGQAELGKMMKVIVGRIHRYLDRQPDNDRYGRERHSVSEPPRSGWSRPEAAASQQNWRHMPILAGKTEPGGTSRRAFIVGMMPAVA